MVTATDPAPTLESGLLPLDPRVRLLWWVEAALAAMLFTAVAGVVDAFAPLPVPRGALTLMVAAVGAALAGAVPAIRYSRWRYALREQDLWLRRGVAWVTISVIPYRRLQFVDTRQGPLERLFGLSQLVVHTAALGTSGHLPGLDTATAENLRERLAEVEPDVAAV
ncbi:MAG TPA: PH domain-containing protein [Egibacteraceae bacterium]|nr:PH domain-containing protein [Egibacteraceae bacterium]